MESGRRELGAGPERRIGGSTVRIGIWPAWAEGLTAEAGAVVLTHRRLQETYKPL